jgi:plasmid maintenance system antidote protein VapI
VDTALRFSKALGTTPDFWLNLQRVNDRYEALRSPQAREIERIKPVSEPLADRVSVRASKKRPKRATGSAATGRNRG